jgi:hypothetical protein
VDEPEWRPARFPFLVVIEARDADFTPADCAEWLEGHLPRPVDDPEQWKIEED